MSFSTGVEILGRFISCGNTLKPLCDLKLLFILDGELEESELEESELEESKLEESELEESKLEESELEESELEESELDESKLEEINFFLVYCVQI